MSPPPTPFLLPALIPQPSGINTSWNIKCFYKKEKKIILTSLTRSFDGRISWCIHNHSPTLLLPEREPPAGAAQPSNPLKNETGFHPYLLQCQFQIIWTQSLLHQIKRVEGGFWLGEWQERKKKRKEKKKRKNRKYKTDQTRAKQNRKTKKNPPAPSSYPESKEWKEVPRTRRLRARSLFAARRLQNRTEIFGYIASVFIADEKNCRLLA